MTSADRRIARGRDSATSGLDGGRLEQRSPSSRPSPSRPSCLPALSHSRAGFRSPSYPQRSGGHRARRRWLGGRIIVVDSASTDGTAGSRGATERACANGQATLQKNYAARSAATGFCRDADGADAGVGRRDQVDAGGTPPHLGYRMPRVVAPWRWIGPPTVSGLSTSSLAGAPPNDRTPRARAMSVVARSAATRRASALRLVTSRSSETIDRYTTYAARQMQESGRRTGLSIWRSIRRWRPEECAEGRPETACRGSHRRRTGITCFSVREAVGAAQSTTLTAIAN